MKSVVKPLSVITAVLYIGGIIVTAIYLYRLPQYLMESSVVLDMNTIKEIQPVLNQLMLLVALVLVAGLAALILQVVNHTSHEDEVVFIEKFKGGAADKQHALQQDDLEEQFDTSSLSQDVIEKIKEASAETQEPDKALEKALRIVCLKLEASQGAVYITQEQDRQRFIELRASFAYIKPDSQTVRYEYGEGLAGQVAKEGIPANINAVPEGYIKIVSGLGQATPRHLLIMPVKAGKKVVGVVEIASFTAFTKKHQEITQQAFAMLSKQFTKSSEQIYPSAEVPEGTEVKSQNI